LRSPKSEGCIIATSGGRPEEIVEKTGRMFNVNYISIDDN
jgi:hypothetical protein